MTSANLPRIGCPDIDAAALAAFKRINGFSDEQVRQLSDYCLRRSDKRMAR